MNLFFRKCFLLCLCLASYADLFSTHLKAGEIIVNRLSGTQFEIKLIIYTDSTAVSLGVDEDSATLKFSDGINMKVIRDNPGKIYIGNATYKNVYTFRRSLGNSTYTISYQQENRNQGVLNMDNSEFTPFYIETTVKVNPFIGPDNLPSLLVPPIDVGVVGQTYIHNPGAYDPEGDSLSYELVVPRQNIGLNVAGYVHPNYMGGTFNLNPVTGDLVWDAPLVAGLYNVAFIIKEWRNGDMIGSIVRDMQIEIKNSSNRRPILQIPKDTCIQAGNALTFIPIVGTDPDGHGVKLSSISGLYSLSNSPASFTVNPGMPASATFNWLTNCSHIRDEPYQVVFKAEDMPVGGQKLFDMRSWNIRVLAAAPKNLQISTVSNGFQLQWDPYACNEGKIEIFRKTCGLTDYIPGPCDEGVPVSLGYVKIGEVPVGTTTFLDINNIDPGFLYSYRISVAFPAPKGGKSYSSSAVSGTLSGVPLPTHASVMETDLNNGKIEVRWTQPFELDLSNFPGPYQYKLYRATGLTGNNYLPVAIFNDLKDTIYVDSLLNTVDTAYSYKLEFYYSDLNGQTLKSTSKVFSSVFLTSSPGDGEVYLEWTYNVPWINRQQYHNIYLKNKQSGIFEFLDSVWVTGDIGKYTHTGLKNGDTVCYYIETKGKYCSENLPDTLLNSSQIICEVPRDMSPPCPPLLLGPTDCIEEGITQVAINWISDFSGGCNDDIQGYNIYYAEYEGEELRLLAENISDTFFVDTDYLSLAGCYAVTATNFYGVESAKSNTICVDLCVYYELPNLITPNRDNKNDVFEPYPVPKNVDKVKFSVYNRWGKRVYYSEDNIYLDWPGIDTDGRKLSSGLYYFHAEVNFKRRLKKKDTIRNIKGWIHIIRKEEEKINE